MKRFDKRKERFLRALVWVVLAFGVGCQSEDVSDPRSSSELPMGTLDSQTAYSAARIVNLRDGDVMVGTVRGDSMEPVLQDGTVILLHRVAFSELEAGMEVAYRNRKGEQVIHQLVRKTRRGWVAKGLNNLREDPDPVTEANLIGVLYGIFYNQGIERNSED